MQLSIIIVSWNVREHLQRCLASVYQYTRDISFEVFVVDNASTDGSADMVATEFPQVKLTRNTTNRGFGAANNQAFQQAIGKYVLFLNDDTEIKDNIFYTLVQKYEQTTERVGMMGCRLLNSDGSLQPSVRRFPTWRDQSVILLKLHHIWPHLIERYSCAQFDYTNEQTVDQVMGAFMLSPRILLQQLGAFDEGFFVWFEEVDLQRRIQQLGYSVLYTPVVSCIHVKGQSFVQLRRPKAQGMFNRSMRYYFKKHHSSLAYWWIAALQPISLLLAYVTQLVQTTR